MEIFVAGATARSLIPMLIKEDHTVYAMIRNESQVEAMKKVDALPLLAGREVLQRIRHVKRMDTLKYHKNPLMGILVTFTIKGLGCNEYTF
ncbi:hypothetical protein [Bacillus mycoides]|uniref:Uncharacterized protein n=1 Tax=Bacillus mycoides (strain KBAB4) TaxID=315730 RepID=A9VGQ3_BACMK|nr:hypothetical protein [Bacillus mycoides]ABY43616.1 hypothetical protein BcerKBAB4_2405 [Bacillus mycoides KBAB4]